MSLSDKHYVKGFSTIDNPKEADYWTFEVNNSALLFFVLQNLNAFETKFVKPLDIVQTIG